jgi:hypothetical protein
MRWAFGTPDKSVTDTAEDARCEATPPMWDRKKNNTIDSGLMAKKEIFQDQILFGCWERQTIQRLGREHVPKGIACV